MSYERFHGKFVDSYILAALGCDKLRTETLCAVFDRFNRFDVLCGAFFILSGIKFTVGKVKAYLIKLDPARLTELFERTDNVRANARQ